MSLPIKSAFDWHRPTRRDLYFVLILLAVLLLFNSVHLFGEDFVIEIGQEDGPFEYGTALFFLGAAALFVLAYIRSTSGNDFGMFTLRRNVFLLALAGIFALGAGEEISWGQRIFGFETPEAVEEVNNQGEFNLHNLSVFVGMDNEGKGLIPSVDRLFSLFWFGLCVALPISDLAAPPLHRLYLRLGIPVPPIWLGLLFPLNYIVTKQWEWRGVAAMFSPFKDATLEIKECYFAVLFCALAFTFWTRAGIRNVKLEP